MNELLPTPSPGIPPIDSEAALAAAVAEIDRLIDKDVRDELTADEDARLEALGDAVIAYEEANQPMPHPSDSVMLAHMLEARGITEDFLVTKLVVALVHVVQDVAAGRRDFEPCEAEFVAKVLGVKPELFRSCESKPKAREAAR